MKIQHNSDYKKLRAESYPSIEDQMDILYHQGYDAWKEVIKAVKEANRKPPSS